MRVLLYCPLNPTTPRIYARTIQSIMAQDWPYRLDVMFGKEDGALGGYENLLDKHRQVRRLALADGYDALFFVEADMIVPANALRRLAAVEADVAYGLYVNRHNARQWLAFESIGKMVGKSIDRNRLYCTENWGKVVVTQGVGFGCTLIHARVLEAMDFRRQGQNADDWYFSLDCIERGFSQAHHLGVVCGHIIEDGNAVIWPSIYAEALHEIERLA